MLQTVSVSFSFEQGSEVSPQVTDLDVYAVTCLNRKRCILRSVWHAAVLSQQKHRVERAVDKSVEMG